MTWTVPIALNVAGALVVATFGALVLCVRPRTPTATAVATFALAFGVSTGAFNVASGLDDPRAWPWLAWLAGGAALLFLATVLRMWWVLPAGHLERSWWPFALPAVMTIGCVAVLAGVLYGGSAAFNDGGLGAQVYGVAVGTASTAMWGLVVLLPLGLARRDASDVAWHEASLLAVALILWPSSNARFAFLDADPYLAVFSWLTLGCAVVAAVVWLWAGQRAGRSRAARTIAWVGLAAVTVGLIDGLGQHAIDGGVGLNGISRLATVAVLAYAVVRHQVFGLDVKVRWTISKGTVAGVFIAVFFLASEVAQQFFGATFGSAYVGIGAAGILVFAMAPIQRAAERLAEKAVPVAPNPAATHSRKEETYRDALAVAVRDRHLTPAEEVTLARLAEDLGIGAGRAMEIRQEAERGVR